MNTKTLTCLFIVVAVLALLPNAAQAATKCRALAFEGGGDKGAYQAGVFSEFVKLLPPEEVQYDYFSGISVGSLMTAGCVQYPKGEEQNIANFLLDMWSTIGASDVYREWPIGIAGSIFFKPSIYDTTPLRNLLKSKIKAINRKFTIGTVNANNGSFVQLTERDLTTVDDFINGLLSSSAIPAIFPSIPFRNTNFVDGGVIRGVDINGAINRCREVTTDESEITIDIMMCYSLKPFTYKDTSNYKTIQMLMRYLQLNSYQKSQDAIIHAKENHPYVNFRYIVAPTQTIADDYIPLNFRKQDILKMIELGKSDAAAVINKGEGVSFEEHYQEALLQRKARNAL